MRDPFASRLFVRTLGAGMRDHPALADHPLGIAESKVVGLDPVRVLVIGSGVAVGYGAPDHGSALTGFLARAVAERAGRGAVVHNRAAARQQLERAVEGLGSSGAHTYQMVVWCPSTFEVVGSPSTGRLGRTIRRTVDFLRGTADEGLEIVLTGVPAPSAPGSFEELTRRLVPRFNRSLGRLCGELAAAGADVRFVAPPAFTSLRRADAFGPDYYERFADAIVLRRQVSGRRIA